MYLTDMLIDHRDHCAKCAEMGRLCDTAGDAVEAAGAYVERQTLHARADALYGRYLRGSA